MTTIEWRWGGDGTGVLLKLFPDVLLFYVFLWATSLAAALASACPPVGRALARRVPRLRCSVGQLAMVAALALTGALFVYYWASAHWWCAYWHGCGHTLPSQKGTPYWYTVTATENGARTSGQVANLLSGLLLLPVSRHSLWHCSLGVSWESVVWAHEALGWAFMLVIAAHAGL
jgi:hypothetical protein